MADHGTGILNPVITDPSIVALDYSWNWVSQNYGPAFVVSPVGVTGGPEGWYLDVAVGLNPAPPAPPAGDGAGVMVVMALPGGRTVQVPV